MDPFGRNADISAITPKTARLSEEFIDKSQIRLFLFMKECPDIDVDISNSPRPPWDISTKVNSPPKYLPNGSLNPARKRPGSANSCTHFSGLPSLRPFSAPCGYPEFSSWKHPLDVQPYLSVPEMTNFRTYSSVSDLKVAEKNPVVRAKATRLLSARYSQG